MKTKHPQHCHATALRFDDVDAVKQVSNVRRKQVRGKVGTISRKKKAPNEIPVAKEILDVIRWHRQTMLAARHPVWLVGTSSRRATASCSSAQTAWAKHGRHR